jgi:hypothetical protein
MRRWLIVGAVIALLGASVAGVYVWHRHEDEVERAIHLRLEAQGIDPGWVSCSEDHTLRTEGSVFTFYRCDLHGEGTGSGEGLETSESAVCTPFIDGRIVTEAEARRIPLEKSFCEGFG